MKRHLALTKPIFVSMQVEVMMSVHEAHAVTTPVCLCALSLLRVVLVEQQE